MNEILDSLSVYDSITRSDVTRNSFLVPRLVGGGPENKGYMLSENTLDAKIVREIIENSGESKVVFTSPLKPKGGDVFVFSNGGNPDKSDNWRADKYMRVNRGGVGIPTNSTSFWKVTYNISRHSGDAKGDSKFKKVCLYV